MMIRSTSYPLKALCILQKINMEQLLRFNISKNYLQFIGESIPKQNNEKLDETKKKEELEKRKEQEAALSEEELNNLREQSKTLKAQVSFFMCRNVNLKLFSFEENLTFIM